MSLTPPQSQTLKDAILADGILAPLTSGPGTDYGAIASAMNVNASPDYWIWRTNVTRKELYHSTSVDGTNWNWTTFKAQSQGEQGAWVQMFMGDSADFSLPNLRAAVANIFGAGNAQTTHCLTVGRRKATRAEKLLASGTGSTASPGTLAFEGSLTIADIAAMFGA